MKKLTFNQERYDNFRQHFLDDIEMPDGFNNSAYKNDVFPSIEHESSRVHIYFADIDGWLGDFGQPDPDWNKYLFESHPTEMVYAMGNVLADDPKYVSFETSDWNEILEKIEEWRATQTELEQRIFRFHDGDNPLTTLKPMNALEILNLPDYVEDEQELLEFVKTAKVGDSIADISDYYDTVTRIE